MSKDDQAFVARLLDAGRHDVAPDEIEREAKIYDGVLGSGPGGGGGGSGGPRRISWLVLAAACVGAIVVTAASSLARSGSSSKASEVSPSAFAPSATDATPSAVPETSAAGTSVWELPSVTASTKTATPAPSGESDELALELAAIENARRRLRANDAAAAKAQLDDFDRRFPRPRVGDEATVLRVEVLIALGRRAEASELGRSFVARRPESIYRAQIARLLEER